MTLIEVDPDSAGWRKARRSMANGNCVEVHPVTDAIAVRDSKNPGGLVLAYDAESWRALRWQRDSVGLTFPSGKSFLTQATLHVRVALVERL